MMVLHTLLVALVIAGGTNLSGNWSLTMNPDFKGNPNVISECIFRHSGTKLSVRCGTGSEVTGSVNGRTVTSGIRPKNGEKYPAATMTGTLNDAGTTIEGTWHLSISGGDKHGAFSAVKRRERGGRRGRQ
jgi:hypothetical protein